MNKNTSVADWVRDILKYIDFNANNDEGILSIIINQNFYESKVNRYLPTVGSVVDLLLLKDKDRHKNYIRAKIKN